jgi:hypothetical protein
MLVFRKSIMDGVERFMDLPITQEQIDRYERREGLVQNIFPNLTADQREFIMTGITPDQWDAMMPDEE